jgi:sugar/nucleoside kinase (ribokinase family)
VPEVIPPAPSAGLPSEPLTVGVRDNTEGSSGTDPERSGNRGMLGSSADYLVPVQNDDSPRGVFVGLATLDVIHRVAAPPAVNEKITAHRQFVAAGGPAANAAVTFAGLGGDAVLITALGSDPVADLIRADLARYGVTVVDVTPNSEALSAVSAVAVIEQSGERSVVSIDGAGVDVGVPDALADYFAEADAVLIDGHHPALAIAAAGIARAAKIRTVVDAGRWKPVMAELIEFGPELVCSDDFRFPGSSTSEQSATSMVANGLDTVVTTHGGDSIRWWQGGEAGTVDVPRVTAVDTLAAGDVFHGAYTYYTALAARRVTSSSVAKTGIQQGALNSTLPERLRLSARVAALRCSLVGPRDWLHHLTELDSGR